MIAERTEFRYPATEGRDYHLPLLRPAHLSACSGCLQDVPESQLTAHRRGGGNAPLCSACVSRADRWPVCEECGERSPVALMVELVDPCDDTVTHFCPCVPVHELAGLLEIQRRAA